MVDTETEAPPFLTPTDDNHGPWVTLSSLILIVISGLITILTLTSRIITLRRLIVSDWLLILGILLYVGECVALNIACNHGLGQHREALSEASYVSYSTSFYASQILSLLCLAVTKLSAAFLIMSLKPFATVHAACIGVVVAVCAWAIAGTISLALQCDRPGPWLFDAERCVNQRALYTVIWAIGVLTDLALVVIPILLVLKVQLSPMKRVTVAGLFAIRILAPGVAIASLITITPFIDSPDKSWEAVTPSIWIQATLAISLVSTCIPSLKRVLETIHAGYMTRTVSEFHELSRQDGSAYASGSKSGLSFKSAKKLSSSMSRDTKNPRVQNLRPDYERRKGHGFISSVIGGGHKTRSENLTGDSESVEHLTGGGITHTIEYEVKYTKRDQPSRSEAPRP